MTNEKKLYEDQCTHDEKGATVMSPIEGWKHCLDNAFTEWENDGSSGMSEDGVLNSAMDEYTDCVKNEMNAAFNGGIKRVFDRNSVGDIAINPNDEKDDGTAALREMNIYATIYMEFNDNNVEHCKQAMQSNGIFKMPYNEIHTHNVEFMK